MNRQMILTDVAGAAQPDSIPSHDPSPSWMPPWHGNANRHAAPAALFSAWACVSTEVINENN